MNNIDWKQKLSSRKFWAYLTALFVSAAVALGADNGTVEQIAGVIGALGSCAVYIFAEAWVDGNRDGGGKDEHK